MTRPAAASGDGGAEEMRAAPMAARPLLAGRGQVAALLLGLGGLGLFLDSGNARLAEQLNLRIDGLDRRIDAVETDLREIQSDLRDIRSQLKDIMEHIGYIRGYIDGSHAPEEPGSPGGTADGE